MIRALFPYHVGTLLVYFHECELNEREYQKFSTVNRPMLINYLSNFSIHSSRKRTRISLDDTLSLGTNTHPQICNPFLNIVKVERVFLVI